MNSSSIMAQFPGFENARVPQDLYVFFDDFLGSQISVTADINVWLQTPITTQSATVMACGDGTDESRDEAGGFLVVVSEATVDEGTNLQVNGESFHIEAGNGLYFETRLNAQDVSNVEFFVGLSAVDAEIVTAGLVDGIGFLLEAGVLYAHSALSDTEKSVDCGITEADNDWIRLAFFYDGNNEVKFYVDTNDTGEFDKEICTLKLDTTADYVCSDMMLTPTIEAISGATATAEALWVDYVYCAQTRYHE